MAVTRRKMGKRSGFGIEAAVGFFHNFSSVAFFLFAIVLVLVYARVFKLRMSDIVSDGGK